MATWSRETDRVEASSPCQKQLWLPLPLAAAVSHARAALEELRAERCGAPAEQSHLLSSANSLTIKQSRPEKGGSHT